MSAPNQSKGGGCDRAGGVTSATACAQSLASVVSRRVEAEPCGLSGVGNECDGWDPGIPGTTRQVLLSRVSLLFGLCVIIRGHKIIRLTTFVNILRDQLSSLSHVRGHTGERRTQRLSHTRGGDGRCGGATHYQGRWRRGRGGAGGGGEAKRGGGQGNGQGRRRG